MTRWIKADGNTDYSVGDEIVYRVSGSDNRRATILSKSFGLCGGDCERLHCDDGQTILSEDVERIRRAHS